MKNSLEEHFNVLGIAEHLIVYFIEEHLSIQFSEEQFCEEQLSAGQPIGWMDSCGRTAYWLNE